MPHRVAETGLLTAATLTIIAILAIVTALGILWGMRLKRRRREADKIEEARVETEGSEQLAQSSLDADETGPPAHVPSTPPPVAPSPPPLADTPMIATPAPQQGPAPEPSLADEPVAATAPQGASSATEAAPESATAADADRPVTDIKGLGPKVAARLAELGITGVAEIAALDAGEAERLDAQLGPFTGRMARDRWIEQARFLAAGDVKGFEAVFGRL